MVTWMKYYSTSCLVHDAASLLATAVDISNLASSVTARSTWADKVQETVQPAVFSIENFMLPFRVRVPHRILPIKILHANQPIDDYTDLILATIGSQGLHQQELVRWRLFRTYLF